MMSYGKQEIEALAMIEPVNTNTSYIDTEAYINKARVLRSQFIAKQFGNLYNATVGKYLQHRELEAAKDTLYAMSDRELRDIGINRGDIERAVKGDLDVSAPARKGFFASLVTKFIEAQTSRAAYVHLMAMNSRELADIGLTRSEIEAAVRGMRTNDNLAHASNTNDHRKAG
jgi:uncharacterized protein YjiS (DUF1127 family)